MSFGGRLCHPFHWSKRDPTIVQVAGAARVSAETSDSDRALGL